MTHADMETAIFDRFREVDKALVRQAQAGNLIEIHREAGAMRELRTLSDALGIDLAQAWAPTIEQCSSVDTLSA